MSLEKAKELIAQLEQREQPEEMYGWRFDESITAAKSEVLFGFGNQTFEFIEYMVERCRRAESRIPSPETVKEIILAAMHSEEGYQSFAHIADEEEQAQAIKEIKAVQNPIDNRIEDLHIKTLLEITDSQAQTIAEERAACQIAGHAMDAMRKTIERKDEEIRLLRDVVSKAETVVMFGAHFDELKKFESTRTALAEFDREKS